MDSQRIDDALVRRNLVTMLHRLLLFLAFVAAASPLHGQNDPVHMKPEFALTFPLAQKGTDVTVQYPVLINPATVIKPGMILRVMYILHSANADGSSDLILAHRGNLENSYSRDVPTSDGTTKLPPEVAHEIEGYRREVWEVANNFILAMAQLPTDQMHLMYSPTGKSGTSKDIADERFSFFDGLLVGLPNGKVTVLAVEIDSYGEQAGIKAGDEIVSVGGIPVQNDLNRFATAYAKTKDAAHENETASYSMTIRSSGKDTRTVNISMPPSLKGGLMEGFH